MAAIPLLSAQASAASVEMQATNPVIELGVTETVNTDPDLATIGTGVTTDAMTAKEALDANNRQMDAVIKKLKDAGVESKDIQTSGISISPQFRYRNGEEPVFTGYQVTNRVSVKVRKLDRLGTLIDQLVTAGANNFFGPTFSLDDDNAAKLAAREAAMDRAQDQAEFYARKAGYNGVKLLAVSESISGYSPMPMMKSADIRVSAARAESAPVEPGQVGTAVSINVQYEMTR